MLAGVAPGLRAPIAGILIGLGLVVLLAVTMASLSYAAGLVLKSEDALAPLLNSIAVPLLLLSGILLPMSLAPGWLDGLSHANPFRYVVDAMRDAFLGHYTTTSMWLGIGISFAVTALSIAVGARTFQNENG